MNLIRVAHRRITFTQVCSVRSMADDASNGSITLQTTVGQRSEVYPPYSPNVVEKLFGK
jgi:hypothetical protein